MSPEEEIARGRRASTLLTEIGGYLESMRESLLREWQATGERDAEKRERLWWRLSALNELKARIVRDIESGEMAEADNG